jgi:hypothetical protein
MSIRSLIAAMVLLLGGCVKPNLNQSTVPVPTAQRFFSGIYACDPSVVDALADDSVRISYPIFSAIFGKPVLKGKSEVKAFATRFCSRWRNPVVRFDESFGSQDRVVLVWSFTAQSSGEGSDESVSADSVHSWGGISVIRFNSVGKIVEELGEESTPGPYGRLAGID